MNPVSDARLWAMAAQLLAAEAVQDKGAVIKMVKRAGPISQDDRIRLIDTMNSWKRKDPR